MKSWTHVLAVLVLAVGGVAQTHTVVTTDTTQTITGAKTFTQPLAVGTTPPPFGPGGISSIYMITTNILGGTAANASPLIQSTASTTPNGDSIDFNSSSFTFQNYHSVYQPIYYFRDVADDSGAGPAFEFSVTDSTSAQQHTNTFACGMLQPSGTTPTTWVGDCDILAYGNVAIATNGTTANGNSTLHFSSLPNWLALSQGPFLVFDVTTPSAIPAGTVVSTVGSNTITLSLPAAGAGVGSGDSIVFQGITGRVGFPGATATSLGGVVPSLDNAYILGTPAQRWAQVNAVQVSVGASVLYRCTIAGTLRVGQTTTVAGDCGTAVDTGLRVN